MKFYEYIGKIERIIIRYSIVIMVLFVFVQAMTRRFGRPISWAIDISTFLFAWVVFLGGDAALRTDKLVNIDLVVSKFSKKAQTNIKIINNFIIIIYLIAMIIYGFKLTISTYNRTFPGLQWLSFSWATLSVPIGCLLMLVTTMVKTKDILVQRGEK